MKQEVTAPTYKPERGRRTGGRLRVWGALLFLSVAGCARGPLPSGKPIVFAAIAPAAYIAQRIAGDTVEVKILLAPGASHLTFQPKPSQLKLFSRAAFYLKSGLPFEALVEGRLRAVNPSIRFVPPTGYGGGPGDSLREPTEGGHEHSHPWLAPGNLVLQAEATARALTEALPARASLFASNLLALTGELEVLAGELRQLFGPLAGRTFRVYHPAWEAFADAYGIEEAALEHDNKAPGIASLAAFLDRAKRSGTPAVFVETEAARRRLGVLVRPLGIRVQVADPFAYDCIANLRNVARRIAEALT